MHIRNYPQFFVKDGKRRAVYYTAQARELIALGWLPEEKAQKGQPVEKETVKEVQKEEIAEPVSLETEVKLEPKPENIEVEIVADPFSTPQPTENKVTDFDFLTRPALLKYALDRGVDLPNNALKADLVKACKEIQND